MQGQGRRTTPRGPDGPTIGAFLLGYLQQSEFVGDDIHDDNFSNQSIWQRQAKHWSLLLLAHKQHSIMLRQDCTKVCKTAMVCTPRPLSSPLVPEMDDLPS